MRITFSVGTGKGGEERDLLLAYRSSSKPAARGDDLAQRPAGWPAPSERADDDPDAGSPAWAW